MRRPKTLRFLITSLLLAAVLGFYFLKGNERASGLHSSSSEILFSKTESLRPNEEILMRTHKLLPEYSTNIERLEEEIAPDSAFTLKATVYTEKYIDLMSYEWILPEGVEVISGSLSGHLYDVSQSSLHELSLRLYHVSDKNQQIFLRLSAMEANGPTIHQSEYNTLDQDEIDEEMRAVVERSNIYLQEMHDTLHKHK